jgi:beta-xylosidase
MWPFSGREENRIDLPDQGGSPGIGLYKSKDLMNWTFDRWLVKSSDLPENCPYKNRFWAPEIHKFGNKYYLIFTADNWIKKEYNPAGSWGSAGYAFVGIANKITGPYKHITCIDGGACDTTLFQDTDGKTYAFIPRYNIDVQQIDLSGLDHGVVHLIGKPKTIVQPNNSDIGLKASPSYLEGPWAEKINGEYYLFFAEIYNDPKYPEMMGYRTGVAYADNPLGPWKKDPRGYVFYGGHLGVFTGPDGRKWFSYRIEKDNAARGLLAIDPFDIDSRGNVQAEKPTLGPQTIHL